MTAAAAALWGATVIIAVLAVAAWLVSAIAVALLVGRVIRNRDRQVPHSEGGQR
jgi:hypothetical protein